MLNVFDASFSRGTHHKVRPLPVLLVLHGLGLAAGPGQADGVGSIVLDGRVKVGVHDGASSVQFKLDWVDGRSDDQCGGLIFGGSYSESEAGCLFRLLSDQTIS